MSELEKLLAYTKAQIGDIELQMTDLHGRLTALNLLKSKLEDAVDREKKAN